MPTVWLSAAETVDLPDVCVKTGQPTAVRLPCDALHRPAWVGVILLVFGFWPYLILRAVGTERVAVALPLSQVAFKRHHRSQQGCAALIVVSVVLVVTASVTGHAAVAVGGAVLVLVGLVASGIVEVRTWVGLYFQPHDQAVIVARCHPSFVSAIKARRPRPA